MKSVITKIQKLLAVAADPNISKEEAELFAEKAARLLSENDLQAEDLGEPKEEIIEFEWHTTYCDPWRRSIAHAAAQLYFCELLRNKWYDVDSRMIRTGLVFVGRPEHVYVAHQMSEFLWNTVMRLAIAYAKATPSRYTQRKIRLSFERGCGEGIAQRLRQMLAERRAQGGNNPENLPKLYDAEDQAVKDYLSGKLLGQSVIPRSKLDNQHSFDGIAAAEDVPLADDPGDPT